MSKREEEDSEVGTLRARVKELEGQIGNKGSAREINVYEALDRCFVLGVQLEPGQRIGLTVENEKSLKVGAFAEDPKPGAEKKTNHHGKVGYGWLRLIDKTKVLEKDLVDGAVFYPVPSNQMPKEYVEAGIGPRPTQWEQVH